ncbi:MAG: dTDP-4-dehydrorhamnose 3,5-epimerase family protein [Elusimicrobia bacterium]|nr:dTDP-4-dehydrorhamnose 3,5-epimerase family protein [Elusimicrobiota bacterium]
MIEGVFIHPLKCIPDERGRILHMLRADDPHFEKFGEIYFSWVYPGAVKGWHLHTKMTLNYAVPHGMIRLVLYDQRPKSSSNGVLQEIFLGEHAYQLVRVPPGVVNGFKGLGDKPSLVANCATHPHNPDEILRIDPHKNNIPYRW